MLRYAITEGSLADVHGPEMTRLLARCEQLAEEKVDFLLLREKALAPAQVAELTRLTVARVAGTPLRILVHSHAAIALAQGAAGVHLSQAANVSAVRQTFPGACISLSCHSVDDVHAARLAGAEAALFSPVFGKTLNGLEVVSGVGLDRLREACAVAGHLPVFALGGVTVANASSCIAAGARGIAGIRMFFPHSPQGFCL